MLKHLRIFAAVGGREQKELATLSHNGNGVGTCMGLRYTAAQLRPYSEALCLSVTRTFTLLCCAMPHALPTEVS